MKASLGRVFRLSSALNHLLFRPMRLLIPFSARNTCARKSKTKVEQEHNKEFKYFAICLASSCSSIVPCAASASDSVSFAICISLSTRSFFWVHDKLMRNISFAFFFSFLCAPTIAFGYMLTQFFILVQSSD